jgi:hypothetical protein
MYLSAEPNLLTFTTSQVGEYDVCDVTCQKVGMDDNFATLEAPMVAAPIISCPLG